MPSSLVKSFASKTGKSEQEIESVFKKAKNIVKKQYSDIEETDEKFFPLLIAILKKIIGIKEQMLSFKKYISERELFIQSIKPAEIDIPTGLFTKSAEEISNFLVKNSNGLKQAQNRLNFFINRAGKNITNKSELEKAKKIITKSFPKEEK